LFLVPSNEAERTVRIFQQPETVKKSRELQYQPAFYLFSYSTVNVTIHNDIHSPTAIDSHAAIDTHAAIDSHAATHDPIEISRGLQ